MRTAEAVFFAAAPTFFLGLVLFGLRRELRDNWRAILVLALAIALFWRRIIFLAEGLSQSDANLLQLHFFTIYREAVTAGELPFWNHYQGTGVPNLAHPLSAMWYPLTPIFLVGSVYKALSIFVSLHFFLAGLFALIFARRVLRTRHAALAFAILFAFNGWAITRAAHQPAIEYLFAYAWLPMVMLFFERALDGRGLLSPVAGAGAGLAWMAIASPNVIVHGLVFLALAAIFRLGWLVAGSRPNAAAMGLFSIFAAGAVAMALAAVEIIGAFELSLVATTGRLGEAFPMGWRAAALSPWEMLRLFFPWAPGRPFAVYYSPGLLALIAAIYALARVTRQKEHRSLVLALLAIMLAGAALLSRSPLYYLLGSVFNLYARASLIPAGLILLFVPVLALAALGVEMFIESRKRLVGAAGRLVVLVIFAELFVTFSVVYPRHGERRLTWDYRRGVADFPHLDRVAAVENPGRLAVYSPYRGYVIAPSYATTARSLGRLNINESIFAPDAATSTIATAVETLEAADLETLGVGWVASPVDIPAIDPTESIEWPGSVEHMENSLWWPLHNQPGWLAWDRNVRLYRVSRTPGVVRISYDDTLQSALAMDEGRPAYYAGFQAVRGEMWSPNALAIDLPEPRSQGVVVIFAAITAYPGWRWSVDGREVRWEVAGGGLMAAEAPADTRRVELHFRPSGWGFALVASAGAVVLATIAAVMDMRRDHSL